MAGTGKSSRTLSIAPLLQRAEILYSALTCPAPPRDQTRRDICVSALKTARYAYAPVPLPPRAELHSVSCSGIAKLPHAARFGVAISAV